jgi:isochorismate synthase
LADILKYRIPGEALVSQIGCFQVEVKPSDIEGFVFSDFEAKIFYSFKETDDKFEKLHLKEEKPLAISKAEYFKQAEHFLNSIQEKELSKAVLSRIKQVDFDEKQTFAIFEALLSEYPSAFVYLISSEKVGTWIGATPEILLKSDGEICQTTSLAGTKQSDDSSDWGQKEINEQQFVTDFILEKLKGTKMKNVVSNTPYSSQAGPVKHLKTDITFESNGISIFNFLNVLHPTPAVSGLPQKDAIDLISITEKHTRELYTGIIGVCSPMKNRFYVNLRCCQIQKDSAFLYVGGGFTKDSIIQLEWQETENKSKTLLNILQNK